MINTMMMSHRELLKDIRTAKWQISWSTRRTMDGSVVNIPAMIILEDICDSQKDFALEPRSGF